MPVRVFGSLVPKCTSPEPRSRWTSRSRGQFSRTLSTQKGSNKRILDQNTTAGRVPRKSDGNPLIHILLHRPESVCPLMTTCSVRPLHASILARVLIMDPFPCERNAKRQISNSQEMDKTWGQACCDDVRDGNRAMSSIVLSKHSTAGSRSTETGSGGVCGLHLRRLVGHR